MKGALDTLPFKTETDELNHHTELSLARYLGPQCRM